jgi:hypothetical protein
VKVLWIGAGGAIKAGYPSAIDLLPRIEEVATAAVVEEGVRAAWQRFATFRNDATGTERTLLWSANPEVVLSVPDLLEAARDADDARIESTLVLPAVLALTEARGRGSAAPETAVQPHEAIEMEYERAERRRLSEAPHARDALLQVLDYFFGLRHHEDSVAAGYERRSYLRRELADLEDGDVVITTNWDTTLERTLLEEGRWSPADGYGFPVRLSPVPPDIRSLVADGRWPSPPTWPAWAPVRSSVRVLKIHGSYGWRIKGVFGPRVDSPGRVHLDHATLLSEMPMVRPGSGPTPQFTDMCLVWDEAQPEFYDASERYLFVYPSYLKQITGTGLQEVWHQADLALRAADEIRVLGASLPESDSAVRILLNPLRYRVANGSVRVTIDDPSRRTHERWQGFLGRDITLRRREAGDRDFAGTKG